MDPQSATSPAPKRSIFGSSVTGAFINGTALGAAGIALSALFKRKLSVSKSDLSFLAGSGIGGVLGHLMLRKPEVQPEVVTIPPGTIPPTPVDAQPAALELANVPMILDMMVTRGELTASQKNQVMDEIKQGRSGFAADIAVADGFATREQAQNALAEQAMLKTQAAVQDIQNIKDHGTLAAPSFLKTNWGNNGVNPASTAPSKIDGISAAANIAQNLTVIANQNPALAPALFNGIISAASLANGIANGDSPITPVGKLSSQWKASMTEALQIAAQASPQSVVDSNGKPIDLNAFITARNAEIDAGVALALADGKGRNSGQSR